MSVGHAGAMIHGTVTFFHFEKGWGAIASPEPPDGLDAWVHFSSHHGTKKPIETGA
jgi:CspA family cold shock protein